MSATDDNRTAKQRKGTAAKLANIVLGVGQFGYATDTKETKVGDGVTTFALLPTIGGGGGASYLKYVAVLNQTGTNDPVATVLENTIGNIVWTRGGIGGYSGTLVSAFPAGSTFVLGQNATTGILFFRDSDDQVRVSTGKDGLMDYSVEIRVYP